MEYIGKHFPVVGIGCSAGGLSALKEFFTHLTETNSGIAFILVQHLAPEYKSNLVSLIGQYTKYPVCEVTDKIKVEPNNIYVIPPNRHIVLKKGKLHLRKPFQHNSVKLLIDHFFCSMAQDLQERAVSILLSGAGTDGTLGLKAVKAEGGLAMVQEPQTADHDSMLRSAISTEVVDYVLPPASMPEQLLKYFQHTFQKERQQLSFPISRENELFKEIYNLLRTQIGHDFSYYKQNAIKRRIERRIAIKHISNLNEYVYYLHQNPQEIEALFLDILVGVTSFFRESDAFEYLKEHVIPHLFTEKKPGEELRIWVPGCNTGEEAYSIAILIQEYLEEIKQNYKIRIFATDIDRRAIKKARLGAFPPSIISNVSPERLKRFFYHNVEDNIYYFNDDIRDMLVFAEQNAVEDPPFTRLDLISCRNLMIFLDVDIQKELLQLFHYSLNENGFLFLGSSETVGELSNLFEVVRPPHKIYKRKGTITYLRPVISRFSKFSKKAPTQSRSTYESQTDTKTEIRKSIEKRLLRDFTPASIVVNKHGDILYIHGHTGRYLEPAPGWANMNIMHMAREGIKVELDEAIHKAASQKVTIKCYGLPVRSNNKTHTVNLTVTPILEKYSTHKGLIMIVFEEAQQQNPEKTLFPKETSATEELVSDIDKDRKITALEQELQEKEECLQSTIEKLETANEELQSLNEEYQSTNEELETSKEELLSVNEELTTVNTKMQDKIDKLSQANNDMKNMLAGTGVGKIFVDNSLNIKRFTPPATEIINLRERDIGRPLRDFSLNTPHYKELIKDIESVLDTLEPIEIEVKTKNEKWYLMRILPYRTLENVVEGAVLTFIEITDKKQLEYKLNRLAVVVRDSRDAVTMYNLEGQILAWNPQAEKLYGYSEEEALKMNVRNITPQEKRNEIIEILQKLANNIRIDSFPTKRLAKDGRIINVSLTASALINREGEVYAVATTERPLTNNAVSVKGGNNTDAREEQ